MHISYIITEMTYVIRTLLDHELELKRRLSHGPLVQVLQESNGRHERTECRQNHGEVKG